MAVEVVASGGGGETSATADVTKARFVNNGGEADKTGATSATRRAPSSAVGPSDGDPAPGARGGGGGGWEEEEEEEDGGPARVQPAIEAAITAAINHRGAPICKRGERGERAERAEREEREERGDEKCGWSAESRLGGKGATRFDSTRTPGHPAHLSRDRHVAPRG
jgi:hypothetical protein